MHTSGREGPVQYIHTYNDVDNDDDNETDYIFVYSSCKISTQRLGVNLC